MQFTYPFSLALLAATITNALPVTQTWQDSVKQALAEANSAISGGVGQAQSGVQSGIDSANAAIANTGLGKRRSAPWQQDAAIHRKRQSWREAVDRALAEAYAAIESGARQAEAGAQSGVDAANAAIGKRQSWQDSVNAALAQANAAIANAGADAEDGIDAARDAIESARQTAADAISMYGP